MGINSNTTVKSLLGIKSDWDSKTPQFQHKFKKTYSTEEQPKYLLPLETSKNLVNRYVNVESPESATGNVGGKAKGFINQVSSGSQRANMLASAKERTDMLSGLNMGQTNLLQRLNIGQANLFQGFNKESVKPFQGFNAGADENNLTSLDVASELPKLSAEQISDIISKHFSKSTVIKPSDAEGIYKAQQETGMSALAILGIGALESGYGTSNIAKQKNNLWGWGAVNSNPMGAAKAFSQMSQGALEFAKSFMKTYYNGYGAKSIFSAGTGNNPAGKGYAYYNDGSIEKEWATKVGNIMKNFYNTAKSITGAATNKKTNAKTQSQSAGNSYIASNVGKRIVETHNYPDNGAARGQCVWYARNRMKQKFGKDTGAIGNGNQMYYNAKPESKVAAKPENLRGDMLLSYKYGTSTLGQKAGHVIYIEDVVGDTVYYTESGSGYYKNKTDGVVKTATRKGILEGVNSNGGRIGSGAIGLIDVTKY